MLLVITGKCYFKVTDLTYNQWILNFIQASTTEVAQQIGVSVASLKRMRSVTEYSNSQLVSTHKQFHET